MSTGDVNDVLAALRTSAQTEAASKKAKSAVEEMQTRFMSLLTTQLKNQDPMNPMDNAQMTSQLAQMSTVEGIEKLNLMFQKFVDAQTNALNLQAVAMVGHGALVSGDSMTLSDAGGVAGFDLQDTADKVTVTITNDKGQQVQTLELGAKAAGVQNFTWDGTMANGEKAPNGEYRVAITANRGSEAVKVSPLQFGMITGMTRDSSGALMQVGSRGNFTIDEIRQIL